MIEPKPRKLTDLERLTEEVRVFMHQIACRACGAAAGAPCVRDPIVCAERVDDLMAIDFTEGTN